MEFKTEKLVRFNNNGTARTEKPPLPVFKATVPLLKTEGVSKYGKSKVLFPEDHEPWRERILDPGTEIYLQWNRIFLFWCLVALFVDPLFFYLPSLIKKDTTSCLETDLNLGIVVTCFRTLADAFYVLHIFIKFRTAYVSPTSRVFGRGELVTHPDLIAKRYLRSDFFIDLVAALPLPQVLGASWYLLSFERHASCLKTECRNETSPLLCDPCYLDCGTLNDAGRHKWENSTVVFGKCDPNNDISFDYGIFENALTKKVFSSGFHRKYFYCLWWGLQNLSSYGQNLDTSTFMGETLFAILIAILGLVLFAHLIGNMQTYLQSITVRLEEWRLKRRDTEEWMRHRQLPQDLRERVQRFVQYKWLATRGVDEESILRALPPDLRRDIQRHLCLDLVRRVPFFSEMDDQLLDAICERLVSSLSTQGTYIVREGDPVTEMLFIIRGRLESSTTNGGRTGFFNSINLRPGDFCGEELLSWALLPKSSLNLPSSTRTVRALVEVEAFALRAEDLKFVANQFRRLHSKKLQHTFRYHSYHWRTWGACFIQAAWRRHKKRTVMRSLSTTESFSYPPDEQAANETEQKKEHNLASSNSSQVKQNLGVTMLASRFAANTRRGAQKVKDVEMPKLQKPDEPDFSAEPDDE
ncbi:putative cyclic nucleotide-gated ion channel 14 isoform X2 [Gossypium australe]|uniref:Putative cyclic nucleotide-gated ion channel 14 isoform X2 n=1 Tax=Gossypium australe TaxID=47621 RepID=A0A5B6W917_9ROSI|nr:putative cyclic nucleotide-gated ion channel 14 isoform X2 [Gossypium australe]